MCYCKIKKKKKKIDFCDKTKLNFGQKIKSYTKYQSKKKDLFIEKKNFKIRSRRKISSQYWWKKNVTMSKSYIKFFDFFPS